MPKLIEVIEAGDILGEGPLWNVREQRLWWTDIQSRRLRSLDLASKTITDVATPERVGSFAFVEGRPGVLVVAFETGLAWFRPGDGAVEWIARPEAGGTGRRFNDGRTDRQGRFWAGTMVEDEVRAGADSASLWRLGPDGVLTVCQAGVSISNGLTASPDGRTLYFADSPKQAMYAYDLDPKTGALSGRRGFGEVARGYPDGAVVDAEGFVWSARWGAGEVVRHAPDGSVVETISLPISQPTCVAFGGPDLKLMFVTSASDGLTAEERRAQPLAGALFIFESDVPGLAEAEYRTDPGVGGLR
ncbi:SMP-30/gluconolactonase/LRE family protein [Phenylobacterium montanum]|uniref:SMP-30/gluconolactonase/LRE family protein n=1 Tax=Phenylobacterium montanum TaxID=2823693 RepID=A0A975FZT8_9CAUL|nr:SMP-30/gluconolactonase/LRE family protein [Caulobacter sp. S6]QUD88300.1 SMP-30/gluconolactonase/LRE family protein [Caulobacter sp. S6]